MEAVISLFIMVLAIYLLSIITDEFFITSLDQISNKWNLPANVAGASLMAMGSSAPELSIALLALFQRGGENSDVGIGTIVGSAVFNILIITGVSAIVRPAKITWRVVVRDSVVYVASIILLLVSFADGQISLLEAASFLVLYAVYIFILFQWKSTSPGTEAGETDQEIEVEVKTEGKGLYHQITGGLTTGIGFLMGDAHKNYIRAFLVSILFIGLISWVLVESAVIFAEALHIPPIIVALTILAGGTSVPDLISSIIVARQGRGDMAVANAVGSNIFDILVGLGLPWMIMLLFMINGFGGATIAVGIADLWVSTVILLATVILLFIFLYTGRVLTKREGMVLVTVYVVYVIFTWWTGVGV